MDRNTLVEQAYAVHASHIKKVIDDSHIHHALVFAGVQNGGQRELAEYAARQLLKIDSTAAIHADLLVIDPVAEEKNNITLDQAREIRKHLLSKPVMAPYKVVVLHKADKLTIQAANALLKVVEEPGSKSVILMTTDHIDSMPRTLQSRVHRFQVPLLTHDAANVLISHHVDSQEVREQIVHLGAGRLDMMVQMLLAEKGEHGSYQWWKEQIHFWLQFLAGSVEDRTKAIQTEFLTGNVQEKTHQLPQALDIIQMIFHDLLLLHYGIDGARTVRIDQSALQLLQQRYAPQQVKQRLSRVDELRQMCAASVNKKTILDYIITGL